MNDVIIVQQSGGLGRRLAPTDGVCGLITNGVNVVGGVQFNKAYRLNALTDLDALKIDKDYDTDNKVLVYANVKDFFRLNPTGELWLYVVDETDTYAEMVENHTENLVIASEGAVKVIGYVYNDKLAGVPETPVVLSTVIDNAQTACEQLTANHYPVSAVVEMVGFDSSNVKDYRTKNARRVTAVVAQDYALAQDADYS
ncbi:MAG TPA: DUF2586 family protein, partial [Crocinitomicaceae bacterium]|nr:DUF2586 family protein [Crocinitomicaceae bacterium]